MKKFLCFGVLLAALAATVGCDDKKTTAPPAKGTVINSGSGAAVGSKTP